MLEAGDCSPRAVEAVCAPFPWVTLRSLPRETSYGNVKALSGAHAEGEIVVLCDADCRYEPGWLDSILKPFAERDDVNVVTGETTTPIDGPYGLALALTYVFPRFSDEREVTPAQWYWANNVAFSRSCFERTPLPPDLPLGRGQNIVHARLLQRSQETVWREPRARAMHALPQPSELISRFVLFGHDVVTLARLVGDRGGREYRLGVEPNARPIGRSQHFLQRARAVFGEEPRRLIYLPLALPVVLVCMAAYLAGMAKAYLIPAPPAALPMSTELAQ